MEQNKPAQVEIKVTWGFAWSLWWRWMLFGLALSAIVWVPLMLIMVMVGLTF